MAARPAVGRHNYTRSPPVCHRSYTKELGREHDAKRGAPRERGYNTCWEKARTTYLMRNAPFVMCEKEGRVAPARLGDHIIPYKGDTALSWDTKN